MPDLSVFKGDDDVEIIIDQQTGESFCSVSGYARMSGRSQQAISKRVKKLDNPTVIKNVQIDTGYGIKLHNLITEDLIADWIIKDNPAKAKQLLKAGVRVFLHKTAGYQITSTAVPTQLQPDLTQPPELPLVMPTTEEISHLKEIQITRPWEKAEMEAWANGNTTSHASSELNGHLEKSGFGRAREAAREYRRSLGSWRRAMLRQNPATMRRLKG
jgi:hypothetical protein